MKCMQFMVLSLCFIVVFAQQQHQHQTDSKTNLLPSSQQDTSPTSFRSSPTPSIQGRTLGLITGPLLNGIRVGTGGFVTSLFSTLFGGLLGQTRAVGNGYDYQTYSPYPALLPTYPAFGRGVFPVYGGTSFPGYGVYYG